MISCLGVLLCLLAGWTGCLPNEAHVDEEKDPHFQRGRNLVNSQDFKGAVDEFEKALESNPRSAAAHFELGWLYDTKMNDYATAIYHYQWHLRLQPNSARAALVLERIRGCKQELANSEFPLPNGQNLQRELDRLNGENLLLRQQVDALRAQLAAATANGAQARTPAPAPAYPVMPDPLTAPAPQPQPAPQPLPMSSAAGQRPRAYVVKEHDTITAIAKSFGVKTSAVLAANPNVDPRRLRVGQSLNLP